MNKLSTPERARVIACLVEGNSINSTCRMTGTAKMTVLKLLRDVGTACAALHDSTVRDLRCEKIQCDEIWSFCYAKQRNLPSELHGVPGYGTVWTWTALCSDSKLLVAFHVGGRTLEDARMFIGDLASRLATRVQLTTDGRTAYTSAIIEKSPAGGIDYAVLLKLFGPSGNDRSPDTRYSPGRLIGIEKRSLLGAREPKEVSTSYVERFNLTMRMHNRRLTRLTNAFSKKFENHCHALALQITHYNFAKIHKTLRATPAMAAGLTTAPWTVEDLVRLTDARPLAAAS